MVAGLEVVEVKSKPNGSIDVEDLKPLLDDTIAGIMMTNPNTLGMFETEILEIAKLCTRQAACSITTVPTSTRCSARCVPAIWDSTSRT